MKLTASVVALRKWLASARKSEVSIALVPTMGALHEGHLRLVDLAKKRADLVVMSIYVNPAQFGLNEDFSRYPRTLTKDKALASARGVDFLFHPQSLYFQDESVNILEKSVSLDRCGASRPGHFDGVVTVVSKLFNIVQPDYAVFGKKDGQQLDVIERLVRDMYYPIRIIRAPIVRDQNGLALSSRNQYLSKLESGRAVNFAALLKAYARKPGARSSLVKRLSEQLKQIPDLRVDYVELKGEDLFAAVNIGKVRLIDNRRLIQHR